MRILFAASENTLGGLPGLLREKFPKDDIITCSSRMSSLQGCDILIPVMSQVNRNLIATGANLRLIQQCGAGIENVDLEAASEKYIYVSNVPTDISGNADSVAEMGIYHMIGLSRDYKKMSISIKERQFGYPGKALSGKTVGIIGLGGIGRALIRRLKAFNVKMVGIRRQQSKIIEDGLGLEWLGTQQNMNKLLSISDYVVLCLPLTSENRNMFCRQAFNQMKSSSFLINLSRGGLVNRADLKEALAKGKIAGAGLDVFWEEPPDPNDPIFEYNVMATPHVAGATDISIKGILEIISENIRRLKRDEVPLYMKNWRHKYIKNIKED